MKDGNILTIHKYKEWRISSLGVQSDLDEVLYPLQNKIKSCDRHEREAEMWMSMLIHISYLAFVLSNHFIPFDLHCVSQQSIVNLARNKQTGMQSYLSPAKYKEWSVTAKICSKKNTVKGSSTIKIGPIWNEHSAVLHEDRAFKSIKFWVPKVIIYNNSLMHRWRIRWEELNEAQLIIMYPMNFRMNKKKNENKNTIFSAPRVTKQA